MTGRYEISVSFDGYYTFGLYIGSGRPLLEGRAHSTLPLCRKGIASVRLNCDAPLEDRTAHEDDTTSDTAADVPPPKCPKFVLTHDADGTYRLTLYAKNGKAIAASPGDATHGAALDSLDAIRAVAREAHTTGA